MNTQPSPYRPIPPELAASGLLVPIKEAAAAEDACEGTLKSNAKSRRLRAYQAHFGAPVMVLPNELEAFLKSRPDIASKHHPKTSPAVSAAGLPTIASPSIVRDEFGFPEDQTIIGSIGDLGMVINLRTLGNTTPSERALVATALMEVARAITNTIPADSGKQPQH